MADEINFLRRAKHDLKGLLTIIKGCLSFLQPDLYQKLSAEKREEFAKKALDNTERLNNLINDVFLAISLRYKEGTATNPEEVTLKELIETFYEEKLRASYEKKGLNFRTEGLESLPAVRSDKNYLTLLFEKSLSAAEADTLAGGVSLSSIKNGNNVIIEIKDTGIGLEAEERQEIFQGFFRESLNLYIAKEITQLLGGNISAESPGRNQGKKIIIALPLAINL
jgi:signal transduction histidine kinase